MGVGESPTPSILTMAKVVIEKNSANPITRKIADVLEKDDRGFFYYITNFTTETDIYKGVEKSFDPNLPYSNAGYFASVIEDKAKGVFRLVESKGGKEIEIYFFGAFKSPKWAAKNLLRLGTNSFNGRKPLKIYR